jgi:hypothetical protein
MKKVILNEEFSFAGHIYHFTDEDGPIKLKRLREAGKSKEFIPPTIVDVVKYFEDEGFEPDLGVSFYKYYDAGNWKDKKGQQVTNWKQKAISTWFKNNEKKSHAGKQTSTTPTQGGFLF